MRRQCQTRCDEKLWSACGVVLAEIPGPCAWHATGARGAEGGHREDPVPAAVPGLAPGVRPFALPECPFPKIFPQVEITFPHKARS